MIKTTIVVDNSFVGLIDKNRLSKISKCVFEHFNIFDAELSLSIVRDDEIRALNKKYRSVDSPTDVLSFPSMENNPETGIRYYGDVAISYPAAVRQFVEYYDSVLEEITLLTIHGILHLLDFNHKNLMDKNIMFNLQKTIFQEFKSITDA